MADSSKDAVEAAFLSSGERERVKDLLQSKLRSAGWHNEVKALCRQYIQKRGIESVSVEDIYTDIRTEARMKVPPEVKKELLKVVSDFVRKQLELDEI